MTGLAPEEAFAYVDNRETAVDILSAVSVKFQGGALANISVVGDSPGWREDISLWGDKGVVYIRGGVRQGSFALESYEGPAQDLSGRFENAGNADQNFVDSILGKEEPQTPGICGLRVIQLTEAIWESARTGRSAKVKV
jgi:predicted dehydrogenase